MLLLERRTGESIVIGDGIVVTVISSTQGSVRLGIDAPKDIPVDREEVYLRKVASSGEKARY